MICLSERILLDYADRINGKGHPIHKAIIYCLTMPNYSVRHYTKTVVIRLVSVLGGTKLALSLIQEFATLLDSGNQ